jgi:hypothetical protein
MRILSAKLVYGIEIKNKIAITVEKIIVIKELNKLTNKQFFHCSPHT